MSQPGRICQALMIVALSATCLVPDRATGLELVEVVKQVESAVVRVDTNKSLGSGAIVDDRGLVVTNYHVIQGATQVKIMLRSGKPLEVLGYLAIDPGRDLAVLKTEKLPEPQAIKIAADTPQTGEKAAAFGNPQGFDFSTTEGIVSAIRTGQQVSATIGNEIYRAHGYDLLATWIQTSAPISPGNSGGPLVNMNAEMIGLNTWHYAAGQNLNFAISAADIKRVMSAAEGASVKSFTRLPPLRGKSLTNPNPDHRGLKEFKVTLPTGRVFSFEVFRMDIPPARVASIENGDGYAVMKHANGSLYAAACQVNGVLHGVTVAQYDNREPMVYAMYAEGKRHGILMTFNEAGEPVFFAQYGKGKPHGFSCFFDDGDLRMVAEHHNGDAKWIQLMSGDKVLEGFSDQSAAEKNSNAKTLLTKLDEVEESLKKNEVVFKKQVKDHNMRLRKIMSARMALAKRDQMLAAINKENADNAAFHSQLVRKAMTGRW